MKALYPVFKDKISRVELTIIVDRLQQAVQLDTRGSKIRVLQVIAGAVNGAERVLPLLFCARLKYTKSGLQLLAVVAYSVSTFFSGVKVFFYNTSKRLAKNMHFAFKLTPAFVCLLFLFCPSVSLTCGVKEADRTIKRDHTHRLRKNIRLSYSLAVVLFKLLATDGKFIKFISLAKHIQSL